MSKIFFIATLFLLSSFVSFAQHVGASDTIEIAINKTSYIHLNGPKKPYSVHVGGLAGNVIYDSVSSSNGVIWVRAGKPNVPESNMIIAAQDTVLLFILKYVDNPKNGLYMYDIKVIDTAKNFLTTNVSVKDTQVNKLQINYEFPLVATKKNFLNSRDNDGGLNLALRNILTDSVFVYYKFEIENNSKIDFVVDGEFFFLAIKSKNKRKTVKSNEVSLPFTSDSTNSKIFVAGSKSLLIYKTALNPIRKDENIVFSIVENSKVTKGRQLEITVTPYIFYKMQKID